jgi:hypothetical protein
MAKVKKTLINNGILDFPEVEVLDEKHDNAGITAMFASYFAMSGSADGSLSQDEILRKAKKHRVKNPQAWLDYCVSKNIFTESDGKYTNTHVENDRKNYGIRLEKDRNRKGKEKEKGGKLDIDFDIDNDLDPNNKLKLSGKFDTPEIRHALNLAEAKLKESGRPITQATLDARCMSLATPEALLDALIYTAGLSKTKNIYAKPASELNANGVKKSNAEKILEMGAKL